jgi:hypothetical protein
MKLVAGQAFAEIPPTPPLLKGGCEKIEGREAKASFVVRGRGNFLPSKPGGRYLAVKRRPDFRRATSATCGNHYKSKRRILRASVGSIPSGPRRNERLFWRQEISPSPDMLKPLNFSLPEFFHSFKGGRGFLAGPWFGRESGLQLARLPFQVSSFGFQVLGFGSWVLGLGSQVLGLFIFGISNFRHSYV